MWIIRRRRKKGRDQRRGQSKLWSVHFCPCFPLPKIFSRHSFLPIRSSQSNKAILQAARSSRFLAFPTYGWCHPLITIVIATLQVRRHWSTFRFHVPIKYPSLMLCIHGFVHSNNITVLFSDVISPTLVKFVSLGTFRECLSEGCAQKNYHMPHLIVLYEPAIILFLSYSIPSALGFFYLLKSLFSSITSTTFVATVLWGNDLANLHA